MIYFWFWPNWVGGSKNKKILATKKNSRPNLGGWVGKGKKNIGPKKKFMAKIGWVGREKKLSTKFVWVGKAN